MSVEQNCAEQIIIIIIIIKSNGSREYKFSFADMI